MESIKRNQHYSVYIDFINPVYIPIEVNIKALNSIKNLRKCQSLCFTA